MNDYIIETHNLTKKYGSQTSVSHLNIHVKKGRIYGLLGRNGAGKTTTMRMLLGLTAPTSGEVTIFGKPFQGNEKNILPHIGCLIESPGFYPNLTGTENLKIFAELRGLRSPKYIKNALELVNLPYRDKKLFSQYSLGMKQRLAIALAVMHNPELLILDEPTAGLDPAERIRFRNLISELSENRIVILSTHIVSDVEYIAKDIWLMKDGKILQQGNLDEIVSSMPQKVWACQTSHEKAAKLMKQYKVSNMKSENGTVELRIISAKQPLEHAKLVRPNLEDVFLYYFGEKDGDME